MIILLYHSCHLITDANTSKDQREYLQIINTDIFSNLSINLYLSQIYLSKVCFNLRNLYIDHKVVSRLFFIPWKFCGNDN